MDADNCFFYVLAAALVAMKGKVVVTEMGIQKKEAWWHEAAQNLRETCREELDSLMGVEVEGEDMMDANLRDHLASLQDNSMADKDVSNLLAEMHDVSIGVLYEMDGALVAGLYGKCLVLAHVQWQSWSKKEIGKRMGQLN